MKTSKKGGAFWPWLPGSRRSLERWGLPLGLLLHALLLLILLPFISLAALLLCEMDVRARAALESSARTRVALAASSIDQEMFWLVRTLKALPPVSLANAEDRNIVYARAREAFGKSGITFCARNKGIDLLASAEPGSLKIAAPDGAARMAAITALSTNAPQVTPYSNAEDKADAGINLWLASAANGTDPVLLQARIPLSFFNKILENFAADGTWTMAVIDPDGGVLTRIGEIVAKRTGADVEAFAGMSQFGWRISAATPLAALNVDARRNWISFLLVASLVTAAALAGATFLSRKLLEPYGSPSQFLTSPGNDGMLMHSAAAAHRDFNERRQQPSEAENRLRMALRAGGMGAWQWDRRSGTVRLDSTFNDLFRTGFPETRDPSAKAVLAQVEQHAQHVRQLRLRLFDCGLLLVRRSDMLEADNVHAGNDEFHFDFLAFDGDVERTLAVNMRAKLTMLRFFGEGRGSKNEGRGNEASKYLQHFFSPSEITVAALSSLAGAANNRAGKGEEARDD